MSASRATRATGSSESSLARDLSLFLTFFPLFPFVFLLRERVSMRRREEAWVKLEEAAKRNPTFQEVADLLPASGEFDQYGRLFSMIDEESGIGGEEDELLDDLAAFEADKLCDTQVLCADYLEYGGFFCIFTNNLYYIFLQPAPREASTAAADKRDTAWRRKSKLPIDLVSSSSSTSSSGISSVKLDGGGGPVVRSQNSTDLAASGDSGAVDSNDADEDDDR